MLSLSETDSLNSFKGTDATMKALLALGGYQILRRQPGERFAQGCRPISWLVFNHSIRSGSRD